MVEGSAAAAIAQRLQRCYVPHDEVFNQLPSRLLAIMRYITPLAWQ